MTYAFTHVGNISFSYLGSDPEGPVEYRGTSVRHSVVPSIHPLQALTGLKYPFSGLKSNLSGLESALS